MEGENVTGYRLGMSYTYAALLYKPAFIATWESARLYIEGSPMGAWRFFKSP